LIAKAHEDFMNEKIEKKLKQNLPPPTKKVNFTEVNSTNLDVISSGFWIKYNREY